MSAKPHNAMPWPTPQDYNEALQNPRLNFQDTELRSGMPEATPLGLPRAITGGFASVYSMRSGSKCWAVRCFLREFADQQERYGEIERYLSAVHLPYSVGFHFLEKGIRVRGIWYPILKMEWIDGSTFQDVIEANVQNPIALANLAQRWVKMLAVLRKHGIAHGDLQHGNVLIAGDDFRLIDYDGMFVPSFAGRTSHEVGHRNYQHPARTENDFGPHLDNFSGWTIYLTLMALSIDPSLWSRFGGGEEHLLFRKEDFEEPRYSRLFRSLQHLKDDRIQKYLPLFRSYLAMRLSSVASPADVIGAPVTRREPHRVQVPAWSQDSGLALFPTKTASDSIPLLSEASAAIAVADEPIGNTDLPLPSQIRPESPQFAENEPVKTVPFSPSVKSERVMLGSYVAFMVALIGFVTRGNLPGAEGIVLLIAGLGCVGVCLTFSYVTLEHVRTKAVLWLFLELRRTRCDVAHYGLVRMTDWIPRLELKESQRLRRLEMQDIEYVRQEKERIAEVQRTVALWVDELNIRRTDLDRAEAAEEAQILQELQARHNHLSKEGQLLSAVRTDHLRKRDLKKLSEWRKHMDQLSALSAADSSRIRKRYDLERLSVLRSETFARAVAEKKVLKIQQRRERQNERLEIRRSAVRKRFRRRKERLHTAIGVGINWLSKERVELVGHVHEIERYRDVRFPNYVFRVLGVG